MDCYRPLRIRNQYNGKFLHVDCRNCPACLVRKANLKSFELCQQLKKYKYKYFVTLTYDNENVPYVLRGYNYVFRGFDFDDFPEVLGSMEVSLNDKWNYKTLVNHPVFGAVGVLWYDDVQRFLKRFRKYIGKNYGKRKFFYTAVGEYGSFYGRPHYHLVIASDELSYEECKVACFENWTYHDWHRFFKDGQNQACKRCDEGCGSYISSYVNCGSNNVAVSNYKQFRQKTCRSKVDNYALDKEIFALYKRDVVRIANGMVYEDGRRYFYYCDEKRIDNVSFKLVPSRYVYSCFHKFKGWSELSFNARVQRAYRIVELLEESENMSLTARRCGLYSDDLSFYRSFCRFRRNFYGLYDFDFDDGEYCLFVYNYIVLFHKVYAAYASNVLQEQMKSYEVMGKQNYFASLVDTKVEDDSRKLFYLSTKVVFPKGFDFMCPPYVRSKLDVYVKRYKKRLLTKHLNDVSGVLNICN